VSHCVIVYYCWFLLVFVCLFLLFLAVCYFIFTLVGTVGDCTASNDYNVADDDVGSVVIASHNLIARKSEGVLPNK